MSKTKSAVGNKPRNIRNNICNFGIVIGYQMLGTSFVSIKNYHVP